ncbi:MAG: hypothetical protein V3S37_01900 [Dehalococcoidia bacterium]
MRHLWHKLSLGLLVAVVLVSAGAGITEPGRALVKALLFIPEVIPGSPVHPQRWLVDEPSRQEVRFPVGETSGVGDLYVPASEGKHPAVVLFLGVVPAGRDDPRVANLANGMARSGIVVLIPWSDVMLTSRRLDPAAVDLLVGAFQYLEGHDAINSERIGLGGFCVGASFAALAAEDDRIRDRVAYLNFFGGYYDARDLLVATASHTRFYGDTEEPWEPRDDTQEVFTVHLIEGLSDASEREALKRVFLEGKPPDDEIIQNLSDQGRVVHTLLSGVTREQAEELLDSLPPAFLSDLESISPSTRIGALEAPVLIMHDREDTAVPMFESRRLADELEQRGEVYYTEFSIFQHMDPTRRVSPPTMVRELWKLLLHMYNVMLLGA